MSRSPFVVFVDESGDPGLGNFDPANPVFVLCAALYRIEDYLTNDLPAFTQVKFTHWWHDAVIFHSYKIRKRVFPFEALRIEENHTAFMASIVDFFAGSRATIIAAAIDKQAHKDQYADPVHPYDLSLQFCLERVYGHIHKDLKPGEQVIFLFEKRGKKEDALLTERFNHYCAKHNAWGTDFPFIARFAAKDENITGLQIADLAAYPIARYVETQKDDRRDWQSVKHLVRSGPHGIVGWGLKIFPIKLTGSGVA